MGMDHVPALSLLLSGPFLLLSSMVVIAWVMGLEKPVVFVSISVIIATFAGLGFSSLVE